MCDITNIAKSHQSNAFTLTVRPPTRTLDYSVCSTYSIALDIPSYSVASFRCTHSMSAEKCSQNMDLYHSVAK